MMENTFGEYSASQVSFHSDVEIEADYSFDLEIEKKN
jgi:hypothetical protein